VRIVPFASNHRAFIRWPNNDCRVISKLTLRQARMTEPLVTRIRQEASKDLIGFTLFRSRCTSTMMRIKVLCRFCFSGSVRVDVLPSEHLEKSLLMWPRYKFRPRLLNGPKCLQSGRIIITLAKRTISPRTIRPFTRNYYASGRSISNSNLYFQFLLVNYRALRVLAVGELQAHWQLRSRRQWRYVSIHNLIGYYT